MLSFFLCLISVSIEWFNTMIEIPLNNPIEPYKYMPEAHLYIDGEEKIDPYMYYEYEIYNTTFSVIRTNYIKTYTVYYRAVFPTYGFSSEEPIYFRVIDDIPPNIIGPKDIYVDVGSKSVKYESYFEIYDNYYEYKDLTITINDFNVQLSHVGQYKLLVEVYDPFKNKTTHEAIVHVIDQIPPTIKLKDQIKGSVFEKINYSKYIEVTDNYDKVIQIEIDDSMVNYKKVGEYPLRIYAKDQSGNQAKIETTVFIEDNGAPKIFLKTNEITINYLTEINESYLRSLIESVSDNYDNLSIDDVKITYYIDSSFLGKYEVFYEVSDKTGLKTIEKLIVKVSDLEAPKIELIKPIIVDVYELEPYILDYLLIYDNYSEFDQLSITTSGKVNTSIVGKYRVIITVKDEAKNETTYPIIVEVVDKIPPKIECLVDEIVIKNFARPNYDLMFKVTDNYDKNCYFVIEDSHVNYQNIGTYEIYVHAYDSSENKSSQQMILNIIDDEAPYISLKTYQVVISYEIESLDFIEYIESIMDNHDQLSINHVKVNQDIQFGKIGIYAVRYVVSDQSLNVSEEKLIVRIVDYLPPILEVPQAIYIKKGEPFHYLDYIKAYDDYDKDITFDVKMSPSFIPIYQEGIYEVLFYVHDKSGNYTEAKTIIVVESNHIDFRYIFYGVFVVVGITIFGVFYIYHKKNSKI